MLQYLFSQSFTYQQLVSLVGGNIFAYMSRNELKGQVVILNINMQSKYKRLFYTNLTFSKQNIRM